MGWIKIYTYPDPMLKKKAEEVSDIDGILEKLIKDMTDTMYYAPGIGLAAPQVGVSSRLVVIDQSLGKRRAPLVMINPRIISSEGTTFEEEGCLSFPETFGQVKRAQRVEVEFIDIKGKESRLVGEDLLARVFQHEIDHLDGILFIERMNIIKRDFIKMRYLKKIKKKKRQP
ncbi:MAG: peptide deformylase [bacterium]